MMQALCRSALRSRSGTGWGLAAIANLVLILLASGLTAAQPQGHGSGLVKGERVPDEILVGYVAGADTAEIEALERQEKTTLRARGRRGRFKRLRIRPGMSVEEALARFRRHRLVQYAEPNYIAHAFFVPNDWYYPLQWHLDNPDYGGIHAEAAWDLSTGAGVIVAVIDTGVAYETYASYCQAPDLNETCFVAGWDFVNDDAHPNDDNSHGTHVAGTIAQSTHNNNLGVAGVAYDACIMPVKVLNQNGSGTYADVANGIVYAADHGAKVINLSLGGGSPSVTLENAVQYAYEKGVTIVAAKGNDGMNVLAYPADYDSYVIAVGATRYDETLAYYSNYGPGTDIVAPGGECGFDDANGDGYCDGVLQNTFNPNTRNVCDFNYWFFQGTSMATPHVAGVAALVIANGNAVTPENVRCVLESTADDLGTPGKDHTYGWGLVNAQAALAETCGGEAAPSPPIASLVNPAAGATVAGTVTVQINATDVEDAVGALFVEWQADGAGWQLASYNVATGYYEADWDTTTATDGDRMIEARATDSADNVGSDRYSVKIDNNVDTMHVGNLAGERTRVKRRRWTVSVTITVHDDNETPVANATVSGSWSAGAGGSASCTTVSSGQCSISKNMKRQDSVTFTVNSVTHPTNVYEPQDNHDPDSGRIIVSRSGP